MRYLFIGIILFCLTSCKTTEHFIVEYNNETVDCSDVPQVWWGNRGEDPSNNDLWKCYNWRMEAQ